MRYAAAMQIGDLGEFRLIDLIAGQIGQKADAVRIGLGDDAAAIEPAPGKLIVATCDSQVEGHHFRREEISAEQLGRRLAAVNLSDIGAMGGQPRWALASFVLPADTMVAFVEGIYRGLVPELARFGACIVGGNLAAGEQIMLDLTLLGEIAQESMLRRSGARPGDLIFVSGDLGASAAGRAALNHALHAPEAEHAIAAHLTPEPRVQAGQEIAASGQATAMLDVSDGLAQDVGHICDASGVDAVLEKARLPIAAETRWVAARLGLDPLQLALSGGEDYELLWTVPPEAAAALADRIRSATRLAATRIGSILPRGEGRWLLLPDGRRRPLQPSGWQHFGGHGPRST